MISHIAPAGEERQWRYSSRVSASLDALTVICTGDCEATQTDLAGILKTLFVCLWWVASFRIRFHMQALCHSYILYCRFSSRQSASPWAMHLYPGSPARCAVGCFEQNRTAKGKLIVSRYQNVFKNLVSWRFHFFSPNLVPKYPEPILPIRRIRKLRWAPETPGGPLALKDDFILVLFWN